MSTFHPLKTLIGAAGAIALAAGAAEAATTSAQASVNLTHAIAITKTQDLNFGTAAPGLTGGSITMAPSGGRTAAGSVVLSGVDTGHPATFTVTGEHDGTYAITLPLAITLSDGGLNTMIVNDFKSTPSRTGTLTGGTQTVEVGATLNVGLAQRTGIYTGTFDVTVDYN